MEQSRELANALCSAIAEEIRDVRVLIEALASVLVADEYLALKYTEQLQAFDLLIQRSQESADLLERVASGVCSHEAIGQVRLEAVQNRLRAALKAA
jgi:hypothetical protein